MNVASTGEIASISRNGRYISSNLLDVNSDTDLGAYRWDAKNGWLRVQADRTLRHRHQLQLGRQQRRIGVWLHLQHLH